MGDNENIFTSLPTKLSFNFNIEDGFEGDISYGGGALMLREEADVEVSLDELQDSSTLNGNRPMLPDHSINNEPKSFESQLFSSKLENHCLKQQLLDLTMDLKRANERLYSNANKKKDYYHIYGEEDDSDDSDDEILNKLEETLKDKSSPFDNNDFDFINNLIEQGRLENQDKDNNGLTEIEQKEMDDMLGKTIDALETLKKYSISSISTNPNYTKFKKLIHERYTKVVFPKPVDNSLAHQKLEQINETTKDIESTGIRELRKSKKVMFKNYITNMKKLITSQYDSKSILPLLSNSTQLKEEEEKRNEQDSQAITENQQEYQIVKEEEVNNVNSNNSNNNTDTNNSNNSSIKDNVKNNNIPPKLFKCSSCRNNYDQIHFFYEMLCWKCSELNYSMRFYSANMKGRIILVTGGRVKIGYQCVLKLLRAGATVISTSRFAKDAMVRYSMEPDFDEWKDRLDIYSINLCDLNAVELFANYIIDNYSYLNGIINNAAQTIKRPPMFYKLCYELEKKSIQDVDPSMKCTIEKNEKKLLYFKDHGYSTQNTIETDKLYQIEDANQDNINNTDNNNNNNNNNNNSNNNNSNGYSLLSTTNHVVENQHISLEEFDEDGQPIDKRESNSWVQRLGEISTVELLECHAVSSFAPFILVSRLKELMIKGVKLHKSSHVINVSAMEGKFSRKYKGVGHPHTNMAKASSNMMTRTSAIDYAYSCIYINSVDTGWITIENPYSAAQKLKANGTDLIFQPPLDDIDGASRVLAPIFQGINNNNHEFGLFFKDYKPTSW